MIASAQHSVSVGWACNAHSIQGAHSIRYLWYICYIFICRN